MTSSDLSNSDLGTGVRGPSIIRYTDAAVAMDAAELQLALDRIFFAASLTKAFTSDTARAAFRDRWLGRFLRIEPERAFLAVSGTSQKPGAILGYVAGSFDDPAQAARFADIGYFPSLAHLTARYPAHLHINLAEDARGAGLGSRLIGRFVEDARRAGCQGVHVVTGAAARNVGFYRRNGFVDAFPFAWSGTPLVMLGQALAPP
ncbi:MAG: GNAT family N-acetyltransferase [Hyphomicrobiaceae bacterium]|nr:GNAT family N-acetyltransferase [Hyphomicrobiaceae bacterium]